MLPARVKRTLKSAIDAAIVIIWLLALTLAVVMRYGSLLFT